ncbi:cysteine proteinase [Phlegmacium glaucopus]|nr:cysteine proteinase [Phlegmacium glaucopus]
MATSKDRDQLYELNGLAAPHSRDRYKASTLPWKNEPTLISSPANAPPGMPHMAHQSGTNPFGHNPNRRKAGNPTSTRVLGMPSGPPPRKKVKTEHAPHAVSGVIYTRPEDKTNLRSKRTHEVLLAPETIDVDDSSPWDHDDNSHTNINSSPDELNIRSPSTEEAHSSKYHFNTPGHGSRDRNNNPPIVPDGKNTEWANNKFSGHVRGEVAKIEAGYHTENVPKIDLARKQMKHKMKSKDRNFFSREQPSREQPSREKPPQAPTRNKGLPLKELYLDDTYYTGTRGLLEIYWLNGDKLSIKFERRPIFGPFDIRTSGRSLTYHEDSDLPIIHDPIFQLRTYPKTVRYGADVECLTIKLDCSSPGVRESYYTDLLNWLKVRVDEKDVIRASDREKLWESVQALAEARGSDASAKQGNAGKSRRLDELREGESRRARRGLIDQSKPLKHSASQDSLRITPPIPPPTDSVVGNQKLKQRPRQGASDLPESVIPRRSTRSIISRVTRSPAIDYDEVILVYPPGVPGAVNITNGDLHRLQPGEFLNDTLIEFGLKLWLKELEETDPTLASQIHVFNSFFYKKLNHQKKGTNLGGYESVRKWTSKFDIFQKKYIIVPINEHLHWYFAIIYEPEHVLVPAASYIPSTRQHTRQSISEPMITEEPSETPTASKPASTSVSENDRYEDKLVTPSEAEVEYTLHDFKGSCSISNIEPGENVAGVDGGRSPSALSYVSDDVPKHVLRPLSPTASDHERLLLRHSPSDETMAMDIAGDFSTNLPNTNDDDDPVSKIRSVDATSFYQRAPPKKDKGKRKAEPEPEPFAMEIDDDDDDGDGPVLSDTPKTYIFTFDSLGSRHPQAIKRLSAYLKMEAQDKKQLLNTSSAEGKSALVPVQPNLSDCGIYLLHLAQTFMSDPAHYCRMILAQKSKSVTNPERQLEWDDHQVKGRREDLAARIVQLSGKWKEERAAKEAKLKEALNSRIPEVVESSDGEIDILEPIPSASRAKSGRKKKGGHAANRLRG